MNKTPKEILIGVILLYTSLLLFSLSTFIHKYNDPGLNIWDILFILAHGLVFSFLIYKIYKRKRWAKNTYIILALIGIILNLSFIHFSKEPSYFILTTLSIIIEMIGILYIFSLVFFINFIKNPFQNASIIPSSKYSSLAMVKNIDFSKIKTVIELGPGTGCFTEEIVKKCDPKTKIILVEIEKSYINILKRKFGDRVIIENTSAQLLDKILIKHGIKKVDLIISGLPFSLPSKVFKKIITTIENQTKKGAIFRFFTYTPPLMKKYYQQIPIKNQSFVFRNTPPLWVYGIN